MAATAIGGVFGENIAEPQRLEKAFDRFLSLSEKIMQMARLYISISTTVKIIIMALNVILLFSFLTIFTSCNGQEKTNTLKAPTCLGEGVVRYIKKRYFLMIKEMINIIIYSMVITLAACTGHAINKQNAKEIIADSLSNKGVNKDIAQTDIDTASNNDLAKMYSRAISDYIAEVSKQDLLAPDTLYFGKRNNGQPDDFPDIALPETINNIEIRLIEPELGKKLQEEKKSRVYINLIGWVDKDSAEFIFVTFSNGFEHKFDCHIYYQYDSNRAAFDLTKSRIEIFSKN